MEKTPTIVHKDSGVSGKGNLFKVRRGGEGGGVEQNSGLRVEISLHVGESFIVIDGLFSSTKTKETKMKKTKVLFGVIVLLSLILVGRTK